MHALFVLSFLVTLLASGCGRVLLVKKPKKPAFMQAGCGAMPKGMKSACCDLYPMDIACGGWVAGACLGLETRDLAECCRFHGALGCPDFESEGNAFDDPLMNVTSTNATEPSAIENGE